MIFQQNQMNELLQELAGKCVVFTNGCFDILHRGHVDYLSRARELGDVLVVGLNTDQSVKRLKGKSRPINLEKDRAYMLDNLKAVDFVIMFEEDTPLEIISQIKPDILVKGNDYQGKQIVGQDVVEENGGKVKLMEFLHGYSTSGLINKINKMETE